MKRSGIAETLRGGDRRSIGKSEAVVSDVLADARLFPPLFECMLADDPLVRMRAADAVEKITALRPDFLKPFKAKLIDRVAGIPQQEVRWHVAQLFTRLELTRPDRDKVVRILREYLHDKSRIVKTFSMQALADIAEQDGRFRAAVIRELETLTRDGSPAMQSRGRKLLARLKKEMSTQEH